MIGLNPNEPTFVSGAAFQGNNLLMEFLPKHVIQFSLR